MRHSIMKLFMDYEKEEKWLNDMSAKGLQLVHYSFPRYTFEEGEPGEYNYRIQLLENIPSHLESQAYIRFLEEVGVEMVGSYIRWVYFRTKTADGPFELYSDRESRIRHYGQICLMIGAVGAINLGVGLMYVFGTELKVGWLNLFAAALAAVPVTFYGRRMLKLKRAQKIFE